MDHETPISFSRRHGYISSDAEITIIDDAPPFLTLKKLIILTIINKKVTYMTIMHEPLHPGEIVKDALIDGPGLSVTEAANKLGVSRTSLSRLLNGHAGISPEMALRLSKLLKTSIEMWINIQAQYDTWKISRISHKIKVKPLKAA